MDANYTASRLGTPQKKAKRMLRTKDGYGWSRASVEGFWASRQVPLSTRYSTSFFTRFTISILSIVATILHNHALVSRNRSLLGFAPPRGHSSTDKIRCVFSEP